MTSAIFFSVILANGLLFIAFIYGIYAKQLRNNQQTRWFLIYLGFILVIELITKTLIFIFDSNNTQSIYPFYVSGEFFILVMLFLSALKITKKWFKKTLIITSCIFIEGFFLWFLNGDASTGYGKLFSHLTIVCLAAYLMIKKIRELETGNPLLIIYAALFLYYAVSIFLFLLVSQLTKITIPIWTINNMLSSVLYASSIYTFYRLKKSHFISHI